MPTESKSDAKRDSETGSETRTLFAIKQDPRRQSANSDYSGIQNGILRLSDKEYQLLTKFRTDYPNLNIELMGKPANGFILYRSHFVAEFKRKEKAIKEEGTDESKESPNTNQKDLSRHAGITWKAILPSEREPYLIRAVEAKKLWGRMYPNGLSGTLVAYIKAIKSKTKPREQKPSVPSSRRKFQPLPSPPVSDDIDFREDTMEEDENNAFDRQAFSDDDDDDDEYSPRLKTNKQVRFSGKASSGQRCYRRQLMTPESTTRELTPPIPAFSDSDSLDLDPQYSAFRDVNLAQLNDDGPSTFIDPPVLSGSFATFHSSGYLQQIAVGYDFEDHTKSTIMDWDQKHLMTDLDYTIHHPIYSTHYCPDSYMEAPMNEFS